MINFFLLNAVKICENTNIELNLRSQVKGMLAMLSSDYERDGEKVLVTRLEGSLERAIGSGIWKGRMMEWVSNSTTTAGIESCTNQVVLTSIRNGNVAEEKC